MADAVYETYSAKIDAGEYRFTASASRVSFDGFLCVYTQEEEKEGEEEKEEEASTTAGLWWCMPLIPTLRGRGRQISMSLRPVWSTE